MTVNRSSKFRGNATRRAAILSGGAVTTYSTYSVNTFLTSGTLTVTQAGFVDVLVVGGGAAGNGTSNNNSTGGQGGGIREVSNYFLAAGSYTVTVGSGGFGFSNAAGGVGGVSKLGDAIIAVGGGTTGDTAGGAGGATSGNGGAGTASSLRTGSAVSYGGGGGGGSGGAGGTGGGGAGETLNANNGTAGSANTGGGGGGRHNSGAVAGYNGGSGIVVVRTSAGVEADPAPSAPTRWAQITGGTMTTYTGGDGNLRGVSSFLTSGTLTVTEQGFVDVLVVGGGGGGGKFYQNTNAGYGQGGGGGGGVVEQRVYLTAGTYAVTVGAGATAQALKGGDSSIGTVVIAVGGGTGGCAAVPDSNSAGRNGGSGGGGRNSGTDNKGGKGTVGQGFDGGNGHTLDANNIYGGGGGGGASAVGGTGTASVGGDGGAGYSSTLRTGSAVVYGGGGGGGRTAGSPGAGGSGGGGAGGSTNGVDGTANTGGGGGGAGSNLSDTAGIGGSGIVVVRTVIGTYIPPAAPAGSPTVNEGASTNGTFSTLTNPDGDGKNYRLGVWNSSGNFVVTASGTVEVLVIGGGGAGTTYGGNGGRIMLGKWVLPSGTLGVVVGAGAPGGAPESGTLQIGGYSSLNAPQIVGGGGGAGWNYIQGARSFYTGNGNYRDAYPSSITGSSVDYGRGGQGGDSSPIANRGMGSLPGGAGSSGVVIVRWEI